VGGHGSTTGPRWKGSCSCSTPAAAGAICPSSWAADPGTPPGGGCGSGKTPAYGIDCTNSCSTSCPTPTCSTGREAVSTRCRCGVGAVEKGGELTGRNPTDRGKAGSKYHLLCDANGLPLHVLLSAANTHDSMLFEPLLDTNPTVRGHQGRPGRPRCRPDKLHADKGYDFRRCRRYLTRRGIKVRIARRGVEDKSKLGRVRWVIERTISWLLRFKRLGLRYDRTERTTLPLLTVACTVINTRRLIKIGF